ncbi:hypothetical protein [Actinocrispum sp. NPDC049592]|uniref:hypothetical protein n=1 Tax=Actinocrispum sp. NPDC049592 TaxID=3154835 RepID=UPI0034137475
MARVNNPIVDPTRLGPVGQFLAFFRLHWSRGKAGRDTPEWVTLLAYRAWLVAFGFKVLGSSWDVSWHFKWLRDDLAPPHLLNTVGTVMVIVLVVLHSFTGFAVHKRALRLMQAGIVVFLIAAPLDVINHRINGLDLTAWSPSHLLLYIGTVLMLAGAIDGWLGMGRRGFVLAALFFFLLEDVWFPAGQQEYGVLELESWLRGTPYAEPELLRFAAQQINRPVDLEALQHFALPIPSWVYPAWGIVAVGLVLALARKAMGRAWTATLIAGAYVAYRGIIWPLLVGTGFPPSAVPFWLVFTGLAVDIAFLLPVRPLTGAALVTALGGLALYGQSLVLAAPPVDYWALPIAFVVLAALWASGRPLAQRLGRSRAPEPVAVQAG